MGFAVVGVALVAEEDVVAADVLVLGGGAERVPAVAGEFVVGAREEVVSLDVVLADEQHERGFGPAPKRRSPLPRKPRD